MKVLHQDASAQLIRMVRFGIFGTWLAKIALDPIQDLASLPESFLQPVGILRLIPATLWQGLHQSTALWGLRGFTTAALALSLWGPARHASALLSCALLTLYQGYLRGPQYVNHGELALLYAAYVFAATPFLGRWAQRSERATRSGDEGSLPVVVVLALFCLTYTLVGTWRLVLSGRTLLNLEALGGWVLMNAHETPDYGIELGRRILELPRFLRLTLGAGLALVTAVEVLAPFCLVSRRARIVFLGVMVPFHLLCLVSMNVLFWENLLLLLLLLDVDPWRARGDLYGRIELPELAEETSRAQI